MRCCVLLLCSAHDAYSLSKLCNIVFTLKLAKLLQQRGSRVTVSAALWIELSRATSP
jgi:NAD(P)-dependent dehydrogenase (short-subunit alcohol dehydrogenase family)